MSHSYSDTPEVTLLLAHKTATAIAKLLFREHFNKDAGPLMLDKIIARLPQCNELPKEILTHLQIIHTCVNFDSNRDQDEVIETLTEDYILPCLESLDKVTVWLTSKYYPVIDMPSEISMMHLTQVLRLRPDKLVRDLIKLGLRPDLKHILSFEIAKKVAGMHGFKCKQMGSLRKKPQKH